MKAGNIAKETPIPADRLAEAGVWIARLHGDERGPAVESGFRQWLQAHDLNARAFELTTEVWEDSLNLRRVLPFAHDAAQKKTNSRLRSRLPIFAAAAAALALVVLGIIFHLERTGIATAVGEQRLLTLEDGTRIYLNTATRVVVRYDRSGRTVQLKAGEALFDVAKKPNWPFVVEAGDRRIRALGTSFVVRYDPDRTAVTLVEGKIAVFSSPPPRAGEGRVGASIALVPGQRLTFSGRKPATLDSPSLDKTTAWRRGQVVLNDMVLANAVAEMNRYNTVRVVVENPQAANLLVNGLFQAGDSFSFANAVAQAYGLRVVERAGEIVLEGVPKSLSSGNPADLR